MLFFALGSKAKEMSVVKRDEMVNMVHTMEIKYNK